MYFLRVFLLLLLLPVAASASTFSGKVIRVVDGDTLHVFSGNRIEKVRLNGIDAPEKGQAHGQKARQVVLKLTARKVVTVKVSDIDRYGRSVGDVTLPDGRNLNRELVRAGYAWWYRRYSSDASLGKLEEEARNASRGIWQDRDPVPPWEWRAAARQARRKEPSPGPYHGNIRSRIFHQSACDGYNCKNCTEILVSREDAVAQGFKPCGACRP